MGKPILSLQEIHHQEACYQWFLHKRICERYQEFKKLATKNRPYTHLLAKIKLDLMFTKRRWNWEDFVIRNAIARDEEKEYVCHISPMNPDEKTWFECKIIAIYLNNKKI